MPERDVALLRDAASEAGRIAMRYWKRNPQVWQKPQGAGPVTAADLAVNDALHARLLAARPDYGWLSEETPDTSTRLGARRVFIVDPIDGTRAFIEGQEAFAIAIGLAEAGRMIAGVVALPALGLLYCATHDGEAHLNGAPLRVSTTTSTDGARVLSTKACLRPDHWPGGVPDLRQSFRPSLAYRLCLVAEGRFDAMLTFRPAHEWDIAAASLIASRAGAQVTDATGVPLRFNAPDPCATGVIAAPPMLHRALLERALPS